MTEAQAHHKADELMNFIVPALEKQFEIEFHERQSCVICPDCKEFQGVELFFRIKNFDEKQFCSLIKENLKQTYPIINFPRCGKVNKDGFTYVKLIVEVGGHRAIYHKDIFMN